MERDDRDSREELVRRFLPLARDLALRYAYTDEPFDDLFQVASLGLVKAVDRFDPERGTKFVTYAVPTILGELKRHFRDRCWSLHMPRGMQERAIAVKRQSESLAKQLGRSPTVRELARSLGWSPEETLEAREAAASYDAESLDAPVGDGDEVGRLAEALGSEDPAFALVEDRDAIATSLHVLDDIERDVLELRFARELSQREIGLRIGYSQMHVSRLLNRALGRLRTEAAVR